ncbi:MAG: cation:proton antiporter [Acidimicrobiia bacterium]|nr:cation:proton antiporter [Acidimicrobiia bacterium]
MSLDPFNLMLVFAAALAGGWVARRLGYPSILGELAAGIALGPPLLGLLGTDDATTVIGKLGVTLLMLYIGIHLDPTSLGKAARPGLMASLGGFLVPAGLGFGLMMYVDGDPVAASFVAVAMGVTSLATKSRILVDLGILNTRIAHVLMAGALFSDVAALVFFAALLGLAATGAIALSGILATVVKAALFLAGAWIVGTRVFPKVGKLLADRKVDSSSLFIAVVGMGLGFAGAAEAAGLHGILGAFLAGLFIRPGVLDHDQLHAVESRARNVSVGLLAPVFFVTAGFKVSFSVFTDSFLLVIAVIVVATVGKIIGTALFYLPTGYGFREGVAVGAGMNGRGAVEIIVAEIALTAGIIDERIFSILVFMAVFTTATVPVLLTRSINWLRRRGELVADDREGVVIVGAGPVARYLASLLVTDTSVTLIDTNLEHVRAAQAMGLDVIKGNGIDDDLLEEAGIRGARAVIATTTNAEVNLLAAKIAKQRFGVPTVHIAVPEEATQSLIRMLDEIGGKQLFGRPIDLTVWDVAVATGRTVDLEYAVADPEEVFSNEPRGIGRRELESLPLVIRSEQGWDLFSVDREMKPGETILALGMKSIRRAGTQQQLEHDPMT